MWIVKRNHCSSNSNRLGYKVKNGMKFNLCTTMYFLNYFCRHRPNEVELLFDLLRVFTHRHIPDFQFLKTFMKDDVAKVFIKAGCIK